MTSVDADAVRWHAAQAASYLRSARGALRGRYQQTPAVLHVAEAVCRAIATDLDTDLPAPMIEAPRRALSVREVAASLGVSPRTVERRLADGTLAGILIGGARRVRPADLDAYLTSLRTDTNRHTPTPLDRSPTQGDRSCRDHHDEGECGGPGPSRAVSRTPR